MRLAVAFAVQQEHGIAAENQRAGLLIVFRAVRRAVATYRNECAQ